jgi:tape measure domain-containing protein
MVEQARILVEKQIERVRRRLLVQIGIDSVILSIALGLLLATVWFLVRPFAFAEAGDAVRWGVPGAIVGVSVLAGLAWAWRRRPNRVASSLALDEKFGLKERVTTFLTLPAGQIDSPVAQALLRDVTEHLTNLKVTSAFPLRVQWKQMIAPAGALALAMLACAFDPILSGLSLIPRSNADEPRKVYDIAKAQDELDKIKKALLERKQESLPKSEDLKELEREFEKLIKEPLDGKNEEKIRERVNQMRDLADKMKERMEGLKEKTEKIDALKKQLEKLGLDKENALKDGAAKDLEDALIKGDFNKAKAALDKLAKDLKNDKLDAGQQKELAEQMKKLGDKLNKLMEKDDLRQQLKKDLDEGKITKDDFNRAMDRFRDLQDLADKLGDAQDALGKGDSKKAGEKLDDIANKLGETELTEQEIRDLLRDQGEIDDATRLMMSAMAGEGDEEGDDEGDGMGGGKRPGGRRRANPNDPNSKIKDERTRVQVDPKGAQRITGYARGGTFNKVPARDVGGALKQAAQDGPEALDRQRIPEDAADITRGYFKQLGNQK